MASNEIITDIIRNWGEGKIELDAANNKLTELGSKVHIDPSRNAVSEAEMMATVASENPEEVTGWGMVNMGLGADDKVYVKNGKMVCSDGKGGLISNGIGTTEQHATIDILDYRYHINNDKLEFLYKISDHEAK